MTTFAAKDDPLALLAHLMELDRAAIEGYRIAAEGVDDAQFRGQLKAFKADHERHLRELEQVLRRLGGKPPAAGGKIRVLPGMVTIADRHGDEAILSAMKNNEDGTGHAYMDALEQAPAEAREVIARGCEDEKRHVRWLGIVLSELGASGSYQGEGPAKRPNAAPPSR